MKRRRNEVPFIEVDLGNGDGSFQSPIPNGVTFPVEYSFSNPAAFTDNTNLVLTSLTSDPTKLDLLLSTANGPFVALGNGDGTFQPPQLAIPYAPAQSTDPNLYRAPLALQTADLNGDGKADLIVETYSGLTTYLGNGNGTFGPLAGTAGLSGDNTGSFYGTALIGGSYNYTSAGQLAFADFNGDGKLDLLSSGIGSGFMGISLGNGDGTFAAAPLLYSATAPTVSPLRFEAALSADLNGDGTSDLLGINADDNSLVAALSTGKGNFQFRQAVPSSVYTAYSVSNVSGDLNGDGKQDVLLINRDHSLSVALSNGDGTLQPPFPCPWAALCIASPMPSRSGMSTETANSIS